METLLLPGLDGTGQLFAPLQQDLPAELGARVVAYPTHEPYAYDQLLERIAVPAGSFAIVAESFSGPLGLRLAERYADRMRALILVATFVRFSPVFLRWALPLVGQILRFRPPDFALRAALLGDDATATDVAALRKALSSVDPTVLAFRLREIARVDVNAELAATKIPILYMAGTKDRLIGLAAFEQIRRLRPDARLCELDAPHLVLQRRPSEAARAIAEFVQLHFD